MKQECQLKSRIKELEGQAADKDKAIESLKEKYQKQSLELKIYAESEKTLKLQIEQKLNQISMKLIQEQSLKEDLQRQNQSLMQQVMQLGQLNSQ